MESVMEHGSTYAPEVTGDVKLSSAIIAHTEAERRRVARARIHRSLDLMGPEETWTASEEESIATTLDGIVAGRTAQTLSDAGSGRRLWLVR